MALTNAQCLDCGSLYNSAEGRAGLHNHGAGAAKKKAAYRSCVVCGASRWAFKGDILRTNKRVCSEGCRQERLRESKRHSRQRWKQTEAGKASQARWHKTPKGRAAKRKGRAKRQGMLVSDAVAPSVVFERDGYVCQLCMRPTNPTSHYLDEHYPTLDHIWPLSLGGEHTLENLWTAHRSCNIKKSNNLEGIPADYWLSLAEASC